MDKPMRGVRALSRKLLMLLPVAWLLPIILSRWTPHFAYGGSDQRFQLFGLTTTVAVVAAVWLVSRTEASIDAQLPTFGLAVVVLLSTEVVLEHQRPTNDFAA